MRPSSVDAVLFDLDDTLCAFVQSYQELLAASFDAIGVEPFFTPAEYQRRHGEYLAESDTADELRSNCFADLAAERGFDPSTGRELAAAYSARRDYSVEPRQGVPTVLEELQERYPLGVVTNGQPADQEPKLEELGVTDLFDVIVFAGHDTAPKPAPEPFVQALDELGRDSSRTVYVGNSLDSDVTGAHAAGLQSVWVTDDGPASPDPEPDYTVASLEELSPPPWM